MVTKELVRPSLTGRLRGQIRLNQNRGDRKSLNGKRWITYGVDIESYEYDFREVLNGSTIYDLLKDRPFPVVIDIMGPTKAIFTLFEKFPDKPKLGLAVSLSDLRNDQQKERDARLNVEQIAEDILKPSTWDKIEEKLLGRKADLIMERALGGFDCIPRDPRLYAMLLNKAWRLLSEKNGILIMQLPYDLPKQLQVQILTWINKMGASLNITLLVITILETHKRSYLKLVKTPSSPEKLPFLK